MVLLLEKIIEQEKARGRDCSWRESTKILAFRINKIGGVRE